MSEGSHFVESGDQFSKAAEVNLLLVKILKRDAQLLRDFGLALSPERTDDDSHVGESSKETISQSQKQLLDTPSPLFFQDLITKLISVLPQGFDDVYARPEVMAKKDATLNDEYDIMSTLGDERDTLHRDLGQTISVDNHHGNVFQNDAEGGFSPRDDSFTFDDIHMLLGVLSDVDRNPRFLTTEVVKYQNDEKGSDGRKSKRDQGWWTHPLAPRVPRPRRHRKRTHRVGFRLLEEARA